MTSKIVVNNIEADAGVSTVFFNSDIGATGGTLNVDGNLNVDGVITYEDVTSVDSVGLITARSGIISPYVDIDDFVTVGNNIKLGNAGVVTATAFHGDGSSLTGISVDSTKIETGNTKVETIDTGSDGHIKLTTEGTERIRISSNGVLGINKTPETDWASSYRALEIGNSNLSGYQGGTYPSIELNMNCRGTQASYSAGWKRILGMVATQIHMPYNGTINFRRAASGSADSDITWLESMRITSDGQLLAGTTSTRTTGYQTNVGGQIHQELTNFGGITCFTNANSAEGTFFTLGKSRGTSAGAVTVVQNNDRIGGINFQGTDGSDIHTVAHIHAFVDGTPGNDDMPGRLVFSTTADGAASPTERLRITSAGNVSISGNVGVQTSYPTSATLVGAGSSLIGLYMGDGHMLFSDNLSRSGGYYIPNGINALNAGPVTLNSTMTLDGVWVIV